MIYWLNMKINFNKSFNNKFGKLLEYIAGDKPIASKSFNKKVKSRIREIPKHPLSYRKSYYFDDPSGNVRDLIVDGYTIVFRIKPEEIEVFGLIKNEENLDIE